MLPNPQPRLSLAVRSAIVHFASGGLAAGFVRASLQPLDTCKTRLQVARHADRGAVALRRILLPDGSGLRGLYRGVVPGVAGIVPAAAVYMVTFQTLRLRLAARFPRRRNDVVVAAAAALGDVAASLVRVPCEVLKQRLQVGVYTDVRAALSSIGVSGFRKLYAGLGAQLTRDVPYAAAEFVVYENLKAAALKRAAAAQPFRDADRELGRRESLLVGAVAGAFAAIISNPADVVKTRLMTQVRPGAGAMLGAGMARVPYRGVRDAMVRVAREEGLNAFAKGITPRIATKALQSAMFFAAYEGLRRAFGRALGADAVAKPVH